MQHLVGNACSNCPFTRLFSGFTHLSTNKFVQVLLALFAVDDYTGFEITQLLELPQPWSIIITWGVVLPLVFLVASALTNLVLKDALILKVQPLAPAPLLHWTALAAVQTCARVACSPALE